MNSKLLAMFLDAIDASQLDSGPRALMMWLVCRIWRERTGLLAKHPVAEMALGVGVSRRATIHRHLRELVAGGWLIREGAQVGGIVTYRLAIPEVPHE